MEPECRFNARSLQWEAAELDSTDEEAEEQERERKGAGRHSVANIPGQWRFYLLIICMGVVAAGVSFFNDCAISLGLRLQEALWGVLVRWCGHDAPDLVLEVTALLLVLALELSLVGAAHAVARTRPMCYGSGIPELKCELQKTRMKGLVSKGMLRTKLTALMLAEMSGLPVGKEGPMVHMALVITHRLVAGLQSCRPFRNVLRIPGCSTKLITVSVAVGTCCTFGVPVGGVLFALEVVPDASWESITYWSCIGAAVACSAALRLWPLLIPGPIVNLLPPVGGKPHQGGLLVNNELVVLSIVPGLACGVLGALFVKFQSFLQVQVRSAITGGRSSGGLRVRASTRGEPLLSTSTSPSNAHSSPGEPLSSVVTTRSGAWSQASSVMGRSFRYFLNANALRVAGPEEGGAAASAGPRHRALMICLLAAALNAFATFLVPLLRGTSQASFLWALVSEKELCWWSPEGDGSIGNFSLPHDQLLKEIPELFLLVVMFCWKFLMTALALSLPLPSGCIVPAYVLGAIIGRLISRVIEDTSFLRYPDVDTGFPSQGAFRMELALIGATAFTASVCRSFSVVIAVYELTSNLQTMLPIAVASIIAIFVSNQLTPSFFESTAINKNLPCFPQPRTLVDGCHPVANVMRSDVPVVPELCRSAEGRKAFKLTLDEHPEDKWFAVHAGDEESLLVQTQGKCQHILGFAHRASVQAASCMEIPVLSRNGLTVATAVPPFMTVNSAFSALQLLQAQALLVVDQGQVKGIVGFSDLLKS